VALFHLLAQPVVVQRFALVEGGVHHPPPKHPFLHVGACHCLFFGVFLPKSPIFVDHNKPYDNNP
jgi:hypothetical protein